MNASNCVQDRNWIKKRFSEVFFLVSCKYQRKIFDDYSLSDYFLKTSSVNQLNCLQNLLASMASNHGRNSDDKRLTNPGTKKDQYNVNPNTSATTSPDPVDTVASALGDMDLGSPPSSPDDPTFSRRIICQNGIKCHKFDCPYKHPPGWDACEDGENCDDFDCEANHPYRRRKPCRNGRRCRKFECEFLHPVLGRNTCPNKDQCRVWNCPRWHSKRRPTDCPFAAQCYKNTCERLHPPERQLCLNGVECKEFECQQRHPPTRTACCNQGSACDNFFCNFLHPADWDPCREGSGCRNPDCPHTNHPVDRISHEEALANGTEQRDIARPPLKSAEERQAEREYTGLPILAVKDKFCRRLKKERILVVTAETGSGKSTQLPQYATEFFGGLVVCTQPRVIAAVSLARRVADEYDGTSVGHSVGYRVGHANVGKGKNRVPGTNIIYMTDGAFIQESQHGSRLAEVQVLIIDEAHERSLNTDVVIGIAKELLKSRPTDFYVVISSATIDAEKFLRFFERTDVKPLNVIGRVYPVTCQYIPKTKKTIQNPRAKESIEERVVSTILELYDQYEGNILAFLPGQNAIDNAIELFERRKRNAGATFDRCIALPLYAALSPEEQDLVLKFDQGPNNENRMVVFCTNIAETSLTINNVRLVIDCGLVNEGYFDYENRLNVVEALRISHASAEQRRGRAGRTAPGHCVRLFSKEDLVLVNTKPQILRACLDLVILQLISLGLNPQEFPFMDPPDKNHIQASLDLLQEFSCTIETTHEINWKGQLFAKLGIDPRYSAFLLDTYLEHAPILKLATTIVAICIASTPIFSIPGETKEEKESGRDRIANNAHKFDSDLSYLVSIYEQWHDIGVLVPETRTCTICGKSYNNDYACGPCRAAYSRTHLLNNKTLNYIESMSDELITTMEDPRWQLQPRSLSNANESDIIARNLFKYFPERRGQLVEPSSAKEDARMIKTNIPARISDMSTFYRRKADNSYFMATSLVKIPGGAYAIDRLHPFPAPRQTLEEEEACDT